MDIKGITVKKKNLKTVRLQVRTFYMIEGGIFSKSIKTLNIDYV